jgi:ABC-type sulfate/molybdate transport systems ATPase subunit
LDKATRLEVRQALRETLKNLNVPSLLVTHDRAEALVLGDRLAVLVGGELLQEGEGGELMEKPGSVAVARALGFENIIEGTRPAGLLPKRGTVCIHAENIEIAPGKDGSVLAVEPEGPLCRVIVDIGVSLVVRVRAEPWLVVGAAVGVKIREMHVIGG